MVKQSKEVYKIKAIIGHRYIESTGKYEYEIHWQGYPESESTFEPDSNIIDRGLLAKYQRNRMVTKSKQPKQVKKTSIKKTKARTEKKVVKTVRISKKSSSHSASSSAATQASQLKKVKVNKIGPAKKELKSKEKIKEIKNVFNHSSGVFYEVGFQKSSQTLLVNSQTLSKHASTSQIIEFFEKKIRS